MWGTDQWTASGWVSFLSRTTRMPLRPSCSRKQDSLSTQEDPRARFFEHYRKEAGDYDEEFMKKYDEDLDTTLIFVSFCPFPRSTCVH